MADKEFIARNNGYQTMEWASENSILNEEG